MSAGPIQGDGGGVVVRVAIVCGNTEPLATPMATKAASETVKTKALREAPLRLAVLAVPSPMVTSLNSCLSTSNS